MSNAKEIRRKIASVQNTKKITRAMEMVAASKLRKAKDRMFQSRLYSDKVKKVIGHMANAHPEYHHPYLQERQVKKIGLIVVTTDRGLCGGLNINLFKKTLANIGEWHDQQLDIKLCVIGRKGMAFYKRMGAEIIAHTDHLGDAPKVEDLIGVVKVMLDEFDQGELDALYIGRNQFVNTMSQKPLLEKMLPVTHAEDDAAKRSHWDYIYEPDEAKEILTHFLIRYIESEVYRAVLENIACEHAASMVAMKSATDNAGKIIDELKLKYNKARQAAITQEVCEIVTGADAIG